jgi:hypothetical protein
VAICRTYIIRKEALNIRASSEEEERKTKNKPEKKSGRRRGIAKEIGRRIPISSHKNLLVARILLQEMCYFLHYCYYIFFQYHTVYRFCVRNSCQT